MSRREIVIVDRLQSHPAVPKPSFTDVPTPDNRISCYATQNRPSAVRDLCKLVDVIPAVGAVDSFNSSRTLETGMEVYVESYLTADGNELNPDRLRGVTTVGITAHALMPDVLVTDVIDLAKRTGRMASSVLLRRKENIAFRLPSELASVSSSRSDLCRPTM